MTGWTRHQPALRAWIVGRSVRQLGLSAGAVVLLASGLFGGLDRASPDQMAPLFAGITRTTEPFQITIDQVSWATDLGEAFEPSELGRFLLVNATIRTTQDRSVDGFVVREALRLHGLDGFASSESNRSIVASDEADPRVVVTADRVPLNEIGPGLTYDVVYIWEQDAAEPLPTTVDLQTYAHGFRRSSLDDQENWFDRSADAVGTFPVAEFGAA